jgi:hypothetical protein
MIDGGQVGIMKVVSVLSHINHISGLAHSILSPIAESKNSIQLPGDIKISNTEVEYLVSGEIFAGELAIIPDYRKP